MSANETLKMIKKRLSKNGKLQEDVIELSKKENTLIKQLGYECLNEETTNGVDDAYYHYTSLDGIHGIFSKYIARDSNAYGDDGKILKCVMRSSQIRFLNDYQEYSDGEKFYDRIRKELAEKIEKLVKDHIFENINIPEDQVNLINFLTEYYKENGNIISSEETNDDDLEAVPDEVYLHYAKKESEEQEPCEDAYCISFCEDGDLKSQWALYGRDKNNKYPGIAIKFMLNQVNFINPSNSANIDIVPLPVCYTHNQKASHFLRCCIKYSSGPVCSYGLPDKDCFIPYCKDKSFMEEKESRLLFFRKQNTGNPANLDTYKVYYPTIKPTIDIEFELNDRKRFDNIVSEFIVGPGEKQNLVFNHLIHIFDRNNFTFSDNTNNTNKDITDKSDFLKNGKSGKVYKVRWEMKTGEEIIRESYKCKSGVIIMKSSSPLRVD